MRFQAPGRQGLSNQQADIALAAWAAHEHGLRQGGGEEQGETQNVNYRRRRSQQRHHERKPCTEAYPYDVSRIFPCSDSRMFMD